jgi:hypothetical protein
VTLGRFRANVRLRRRLVGVKSHAPRFKIFQSRSILPFCWNQQHSALFYALLHFRSRRVPAHDAIRSREWLKGDTLCLCQRQLSKE